MQRVKWTQLKAFIDQRGLKANYYEFEDRDWIYAFDGPMYLYCRLRLDPADDADIVDWQDNYKPSANAILQKNAPAQGVPLVGIRRPEGSSATVVSHDFCNKSTWYQNSTQVTGETLSAAGLVYSAVNDGWIDLEHGKVYNEHVITDKQAPKIYDNAVEVTSGFTIDYENGTVTFDSAPAGAVTADYYYGANSLFTLAPDANKVLMLEHSELQFSKDIQISTPINFEIWVYNPADLPNKVPYKVIKYKNMKDIINSCNLGQGYIPAIGGLTQDVIVFPFNYVTVIPMAASVGAELRITADNDTELTGEWGTVTLYTMSEDE